VQSQELQAVGQLASGVAHEFNNILTVIVGNLSVLEAEFDTSDPRRGDVRRIAESVDRAALLIRQLLAFSRHQRLAPQIDDLNRLIASQERPLTRLVGNAVHVTLALSGDACLVRIDPTHVEQVIVNVALNARDAMPHGGALHIETATLVVEPGETFDWGHLEPGRYAVMRVSDTGHGMSAEVQARVFEPFFTTKDVGKGTGLGLSTVYGIIAQNGGHIHVASEPGVGTTFTILLPLVPLVTAHDAAMSPCTPRGPETILLVDDEPTVRNLAASILRRQGYWVLEASNALEALGIAAREPGPIHLLLTDVVMPVMTGAGLARRWSTARPGSCVLFMSGYTDDPESLGLRPRADFIAKPFTPGPLLARVRALLDRGSGRGASAIAGPSDS
jgi:CheY-like chemotaxis protein